MNHLLRLIVCSCALAVSAADKPNIILILSDDVGLGNIGCYGGAYKTPHIDALASQGLKFANAYSTPLCGPTRCQILTGRYPFRTGLNSNHAHDAVDPKREVMIPTVLKQAGYATASVGKWGQICLGPGEWGFDEYLVFQGSGKYWGTQPGGYTQNGKHMEVPEGAHLPDLMHDFATSFIERNRDKPFFLYYPMSHIHGPILRTPESKAGADAKQLYTDNVEYMDKLVGRLMGELDRLKLREKTLVIFTGDNGTAHFGAAEATVNGRAISGMKGTMLDGGSHEPFIASWPGTTPAGKNCADLVDFTDFMTTFAELAGAKLPERLTFDGHSFAAALKGGKGEPRQWVYVELGGKSFARDARYKLTNQGELFDLKNAPFEEIPVPADSKDEAVVAARGTLQKVLDEHPAKPVTAADREAKSQKKAKRPKNR